MGALQVVARLSGRAAEPILHLRVVNPHVAGVLGSAAGPAQAFAARQSGPAPDGSPSDVHTIGVSSFAFQVRHRALPASVGAGPS
jgi:hypothetical protein